ncbi:hypothetical protein ILYODFUR_026203 [Ilyodon furcidens]|uniref:Uncharacterized protein n=1 Tax=Ilyodon furcidens TaxID=33524 RepID=A0ABV0U0Q1_9TELE
MGVLEVEADRYTKACQNSYLNPHPVPPRTIAARRIAPAMDPIMILVPLGPAQRKEGRRKGAEEEEGQKQNNTTKKHTSEDSINTVRQQHQQEKERPMVRYLQTNREMKGRGGPSRLVAGEQGRSRGITVTQRKKERVVLLCFHSPSPALSAGHPLAQGGCFGPKRAAA